jgi:UDP-N-acetylmuramoylalanine-D-glutamate ligase
MITKFDKERDERAHALAMKMMNVGIAHNTSEYMAAFAMATATTINRTVKPENYEDAIKLFTKAVRAVLEGLPKDGFGR